MHTDYTPPAYGAAAGYSTVETLLDEAASNLRRYSRGSTGQRMAGSMRVVKPNSTSNSPRGSIGLGRRRTVMTDRRRMVIVDQSPSAFTSNDGLQVPAKSSRPFSWHPSSHLGPQPVYHSAYPVPCPNTNNEFHIFDLPPTPAVYSGYTSPSSTFSPLSIPFTGYDEQQYPFIDPSTPCPPNTDYIQHQPVGNQPNPNYTSTTSDNTDSSLYSHFDWNNFAVNGFERSTAPPTPENFLPIQHPDPIFSKDEAIPYHSLSDDTQEEEEGEILCGMGLYDSPDVGKTSSFDPQLDTYRSSMMSQLLGPSYLREPTGKGLKLEETWNPPPSDDEENDEDDDEQDGEGEEDMEDAIIETKNSEAVKDGNPSVPVQKAGSTLFSPNITSSHRTLENDDRICWL